MEEKITDKIENEYVKIYFEEGIIHASYQPNMKMNVSIAKKTVEFRKTISRDKGNLPLLADIRNLKSVTNDAREWLAQKEAQELLSAVAVLTNNPIQNLFANFYLKLSKPSIPTQLFTDKEKAIRWLKLYLQQN